MHKINFCRGAQSQILQVQGPCPPLATVNTVRVYNVNAFRQSPHFR